jgi:DNA transposition AAA+ family ATPase
MAVTEKFKKQVVQLIEHTKLNLGSYVKVAERCKVTKGVISFMVNNNWQNVSDDMWLGVALSLKMRTDEWKVVETTVSRMVDQLLGTSKEEQLFMGLAHRAGVGKSEACKGFQSRHNQSSAFLMECREWSKREFLEQLCRNLGLDTKRKGYLSIDDLLMMAVGFFQERFFHKPLLIIDEADKLKPAALRSLITFYNECSDKLGLVIVGTDNLEIEIKRGVRYNRKGYDELDSRFGRNFIHLYGSNFEDVKSICEANGINNTATIKRIFKECEPMARKVDERFVDFVQDLRRVKRAVTRELLKASAASS